MSIKYAPSEQISADSPRMDTPADFKVQLYEHQKAVLYRLLNIERERKCLFKSRAVALTRDVIHAETQAAVLCEPFGSGKTVEILALLTAQPTPAVKLPTYSFVQGGIVSKSEHNNPGYADEIRAKFTGAGAWLMPNLIIVGNAVLVQWRNAIRSMTNLTALVINTVDDMEVFWRLLRERKLNNYNIVLLKNGIMAHLPTGFNDCFAAAGAAGANISSNNSVAIMARLTRGYVWSRVIYDDYDVIGMPASTPLCNALFSYFVTASKKEFTTAHNRRRRQAAGESIGNATLTAADWVFAARARLAAVHADELVWSMFAVQCAQAFIDDSTNVTRICGWKYVYDNPDDTYIKLLGVMGEEDTRAVMEMLNSDAIGTAAAELGIKSDSIADIFKKVLDDKYARWRAAVKIIESCTAVLALPTAMEPLPITTRERILVACRRGRYANSAHTAVVDPGAPAGDEFAEAGGDNTTAPPPDLKKLRYLDGETRAQVMTLQKDTKDAEQQYSLAIRRVTSNVREGMCQICNLPLDEGVLIMKCCGLVVCEHCGVDGSNFKKQYDSIHKIERIVGYCANCKHKIFPKTGLVFLDQSVDLSALLHIDDSAVVQSDEIPDDGADVNAALEDKPKPKITALIDICAGRAPAAAEPQEININKLLYGVRDKEPPAGAPKRVLVFTNYNETIDLIRKELTAAGITHAILHGTPTQKDAIIQEFRERGCVLLINSSIHCAGLDLQFATDLVYFHKIINEAVEAQVAGRAQRIGREYNLHIHHLVYKNEVTLLNMHVGE